MFKGYLGQEYPEGRTLSLCRASSASSIPSQQLEKGGSLGKPEPIVQEPPTQCVGSKRRWGEMKPCHDYVGRGGRRMAPYNTTEVSSSSLRTGHNTLQPSTGETVSEACAPAIPMGPIYVQDSKNHTVNAGLKSMVYHDTRSSIPQHKWIGTCKQPVHQFMASDVVRTANASIKSDRYTPAASHAGTERLFKPNGLNNTVRTMIRAPSIQDSSPELHLNDLREQEGRTTKNRRLFCNDPLKCICEVDPTSVSPQYSTMASKKDILFSDLPIKDKWSIFLQYLSNLERNSKHKSILYKAIEGGKEFLVVNGGRESLARDLPTEVHQEGKVPADFQRREGRKAGYNLTTRTDQTDRVDLAVLGTEYPAAATTANDGRKAASAEMVANGNGHWPDNDEASNTNNIEPKSGHAATIYDGENEGISQNSLLSVMGGISEGTSPRLGRRRYTGAEKQTAVDISNEKIYQGKGPNGTRGKKVTSKLLGIPISTLYKWESDGMKNRQSITTEHVVNHPFNTRVKNSPKHSNNVGVQEDSPKSCSNAGLLQGSSPKFSIVGGILLQGSPKPSNAGVQEDSPKSPNAGPQVLSPKCEGANNNNKMNQIMRYSDEDKLVAIEMSKQITKNGTGRNGTRGKTSVARQIGVSVKTMWRWEQNEHFYRMRIKKQKVDKDFIGRKLLMLHKACVMVQNPTQL